MYMTTFYVFMTTNRYAQTHKQPENKMPSTLIAGEGMETRN